MPGIFRKDDLRIIRTQRVLLDAMPKLLQTRSFVKLTVNDICEEAQLSRTAFYSHYQDKYDLLKKWFMRVKSEIIVQTDDKSKRKNRINHFMRENTKVIANLLENANDEALGLIKDFTVSLVGIPEEREIDGSLSQKYVILQRFCGGGIVNCLQWQVANGFPLDKQFSDKDFYSLLDCIIKWHETK